MAVACGDTCGVSAHVGLGRARSSIRYGSRVAADTSSSREVAQIPALSGGSRRATARSLNSSLYRATVVRQCPADYRGIEATSSLTPEAGKHMYMRRNSLL